MKELQYFYIVESGYFLLEDTDKKVAPIVYGPSFSIGHLAMVFDDSLPHNISPIREVVTWAIVPFDQIRVIIMAPKRLKCDYESSG